MLSCSPASSSPFPCLLPLGCGRALAEGSVSRGCPPCPHCLSPVSLSPVLRRHPTRGRCDPTLGTSDTRDSAQTMGTVSGTCPSPVTLSLPGSTPQGWSKTVASAEDNACPTPWPPAPDRTLPCAPARGDRQCVPNPNSPGRAVGLSDLPGVPGNRGDSHHRRGAGAACLRWRPRLQDLYHFLP